ncbi:MAG: hypothetical protein AB7P22_03765 [Vicinamibacterales bacterium]
MGVMVAYPVEVKQYTVSVTKDHVSVRLVGVEQNAPVAPGPAVMRTVGHMTFGDPNPTSDKDFITRGGTLRMARPIEMFAGTVDLLRHERPIYLLGDGTLTTSSEPSSEDSEDR